MQWQGFAGQRFAAEVLDIKGSGGREAASATATVRYDELLADDEVSKLSEDVDVRNLRPCPPRETADVPRAAFLEGLKHGTLIEAYVQDAWWPATVFEGTVGVLRDGEDVHERCFRVVNFPGLYARADEHVRPRWQHLVDRNVVSWTTMEDML